MKRSHKLVRVLKWKSPGERVKKTTKDKEMINR